MGQGQGSCSKFAEAGQEWTPASAFPSDVTEETINKQRGSYLDRPQPCLAARIPDGLKLPRPEHLQGPSVVDVNEATKIEFLTDVEGNWEYFLRWVRLSETLYWFGEDRGAFGPGDLCLHDNCMFVFGGDAPDKGPGDIRFVRILLSLKSRYADRVFIILGNRDINKLRFSAELMPGVEPFVLPWDPKALSLPEWLKLFPGLKEGEVTTMKWMLHYMGCQNTTFDTRKHELALLNPGTRVTDEDVVESFRCSVDPSGQDPWMLRLLEAGKLVVKIGDTLFVHGGMHDKVIGQLPNQKDRKADMSLTDWIGALNAWKDAQIKDFYSRPHWSTNECGRRVRGAEDLILYGTPGWPDGATIVYYNPFLDGNPQPLPEQTERYLDSARIRRVLSGHQPHGQTPTVVRHPTTGMLRVTGDTSYSAPSADKLFNPANMRGGAVSIIRIQGEALRIHGVLADGRQHGFTLQRDATKDIMPDSLVGRQLSDGSWLKTVLRGGDGNDCVVQAVLGRGFNLVTEDMHFGKACLKMKREFAVKQLARPLSDIMPEWLTTNTPRSMRQYGAEEDPQSRRPRRGITNIEYNREDFLTADTFLINVGGVVDKVRAVSSRGSPKAGEPSRIISRSGTDVDLERRIVLKINSLIDMGKRVLFLSNNSNDSRRGAATKLAAKGINIPAAQFYRHVLNTSYTCAWFLKNAGVTNPFIICSDTGILEELREIGIKKYVATVKDDGTPKKEYLQAANFANVLECVKKAPDVDAVVVGWDQQLTTLKIDVATAYLTWSDRPDDDGGNHGVIRPIPLISCSSDSGGILGTTPDSYLADRLFNDRMVKTVGNGLMAKIVCETAGGSHMYFDVGQPSELMLEAMRRSPEEQGLGVNPKTAVLIGDVLSTDIAMANRGGMRSLLVFSGETKKSDFFSKAVGSHECPTWILDALSDL